LIEILIFCSIHIESDSEHDDDNDGAESTGHGQLAKKQKIMDLDLK
jgi:hypothetical protein